MGRLLCVHYNKNEAIVWENAAWNARDSAAVQAVSAEAGV